MRRFDLSGGLSRYHFKFDDGWRGTFETYVSVSWDGPLYPTLSYTRDFDLGDGTLAEASVGHGVDVGRTRLEGRVSLVYNGHYYRVDSGLGYLQLGLEAPIALGRLTLTPRIAFLKGLDTPEIESTAYGGLSATLEL